MDVGHGGKVCKLRKALDGSKQSPKAWFGWFSDIGITSSIQKFSIHHFVSSMSSKVKNVILFNQVNDIIIESNVNDIQ